jgi:NAD-dependent deacetylase sirtuin 5
LQQQQQANITNTDQPPPTITVSDLPHCPHCTNLLRPGIVWFGERLATGAPDNIDEWIADEPVDLVIAAGTSLRVFPAAEWVHTVRAWGAPLAVFDVERGDELMEDFDEDEDWFFQGDIAVMLPRILSLVDELTAARQLVGEGK